MKKPLVISGSKIIGVQPSNPNSVMVDVPNDFDIPSKPLWAWEYVNGSVVFNQSILDQALVEKQKEEYQKYLDDTDWYVIRKMERNIDIPSDVSTARLEAINFLDIN